MIASIQKILKIEPIKDADRIEKVQVLGWWIVTEKNQFKEGDYCIYIEIDSIVPAVPEFEFLRKYNFRVKTIKLRGQISQGLVLPITVLNDKQNLIGEDVSDMLGIKHYEKPIPFRLQGQIRKAGLPFGIPVTDEVRIQSAPELIDMMIGKEIYISTKVDGTSATFAIFNGDYHVCSRNNSYFQDVENIYWTMSYKYNLEEKLKQANLNIAIRGEICGPNIQRNRLGLKDHKLLVFDVFDIDSYRYYNYLQLKKISEEFELEMVPVEKVTTFNYSLEELLLNHATGLYEGTKNRKEGIVVRTTDNDRISFKVVNNDYLLKDEE
jgi:RNA ligase (TIGR02306 family)